MKKIEKALPYFTVLSPVLIYLLIRNYYPDLLIFDNLLKSLEALYAHYGLGIIFVAGIAESVFLLNMFVPGSFVILLGAVLAGQGILSLPEVIIPGTAGLLLGYSFNYLVGYFGWHRLLGKTKLFQVVIEAEKRIQKQETFIVFLSGFNPNALAVVSLASGMLKIDFRRFIIKVGLTQLAWASFWGILFYVFGPVMLKNVYLIVLAALIFVAATYWFKNKFFLRTRSER